MAIAHIPKPFQRESRGQISRAIPMADSNGHGPYSAGRNFQRQSAGNSRGQFPMGNSQCAMAHISQAISRGHPSANFPGPISPCDISYVTRGMSRGQFRVAILPGHFPWRIFPCRIPYPPGNFQMQFPGEFPGQFPGAISQMPRPISKANPRGQFPRRANFPMRKFPILENFRHLRNGHISPVAKFPRGPISTGRFPPREFRGAKSLMFQVPNFPGGTISPKRQFPRWANFPPGAFSRGATSRISRMSQNISERKFRTRPHSPTGNFPHGGNSHMARLHASRHEQMPGRTKFRGEIPPEGKYHEEDRSVKTRNPNTP